jgi:tyrosine phenol-lyase
MAIKLSNGQTIPIEMHRVKIVQQMRLLPIDERLRTLEKGGFNTFCLPSKDVFIDLLTDSGTNAMSDKQLGAMMIADDAYAGSESFERLAASVREILGFRLVLPVHQGRGAEHIIAHTFIKPGDSIPMNFHFTTTKVQVIFAGGIVEELFIDEALNTQSIHPFKGNMDIKKLRQLIKKVGSKKIPFIRMEATTGKSQGCKSYRP